MINVQFLFSPSNSKTASSNTKRKCGVVSFIYKEVLTKPLTTINDVIPHTRIDMTNRCTRFDTPCPAISL